VARQRTKILHPCKFVKSFRFSICITSCLRGGLYIALQWRPRYLLTYHSCSPRSLLVCIVTCCQTGDIPNAHSSSAAHPLCLPNWGYSQYQFRSPTTKLYNRTGDMHNIPLVQHHRHSCNDWYEIPYKEETRQNNVAGVHPVNPMNERPTPWWWQQQRQ